MSQFEFFQQSNFKTLGLEVNVWLQTQGDAIEVISWDLQRFENVYTMTIFYSEVVKPEKVGFSSNVPFPEAEK